MEHIVCKDCKTSIWAFTGRVMGVMKAEDFHGINGFPDPDPTKIIHCPACGANPFVVHNWGMQALTPEGQLIPNVRNENDGSFILNGKN